MIQGNEYIETVKAYFMFLTTEFSFIEAESIIRGNAFYDIKYNNKTKVISISYENIEDYFQVVIFLLEKDKMPNYDDKSRTLHLYNLNRAIIPKLDNKEINLNNDFFSNFSPKNMLEKNILKSAKDLRLCLRHFSSRV